MSQEFGGEKILPPSPRKLEQARERGQVVKSQDLNAAVSLLAALLGLWFLGPAAWRGLLEVTQYYFSEAPFIGVSESEAQPLLIQALMLMMPIVIPLMLILLAGSIASNVLQYGVLFTGQALVPRLERINPISGFRRFFSARSAVELVKSLAKLVIFGWVVWVTLDDRVPEILSLIHASPEQGAFAIWSLLFEIWWRVVVVMAAIGISDYLFQRWQQRRELMMSQDEARQELKQLEGDPRIKQRIRAIQRQMAMQRMMREVPEADVIITNPTTYAVAIRYNADSMDAPRVTAKGARLLAERIRAIAVEHGVPIVERPELARTLYRTIEVGRGIPGELFRTVAEVLAYVYQIDRRQSKVQERAEATRFASV